MFTRGVAAVFLWGAVTSGVALLKSYSQMRAYKTTKMDMVVIKPL